MRLSSFNYAVEFVQFHVKFFDFRAEFVENPAASVVR
jgi:hypothetical protein